MAYLQLSELRAQQITKDARVVLAEAKAAASTRTRFQIFLSHAKVDEVVIAAAYAFLTKLGYTVYVDWICDPHLDREQVTPATAAKLRERMRECESLFYAVTDNSAQSRWMPWELGYFDGFRRGKVAILPIVESGGDPLKGQEYLGLYPRVEKPNILTASSEPVVSTPDGTSRRTLREFHAQGLKL